MKRNVLVVEDNELNREMLTEILCEDYSVFQAENGQVALEILETEAEISLIFLDLMMPVMNGNDFLKIIKADEELSLIPVIVMTQGDTESDEIEALSNGATDFVPKPYRPKVILHRAASLIRLRETAAMVNQLKYDSLTGLFTKEYFYRTVREQLDEHPDTGYSIVCTNIENFKLYNDSHGRTAGDEMLKRSAERMMQIIAPDGIGARFSADRFLCLVAGRDHKIFDDPEDEESYARLFYKKNSTHIKWGVYEITDRSISVEQMCDFALMAVSSIRGQYNTSYALYDDKLMDRLMREKQITDSMESALSEGQFDVYFQPKYDLHNDAVAGAEALVRWRHPEMGFISPGEFIPLFEKNGFISRLDKYVWKKVCEYIYEWKKQGIEAVPVSVNISRADVYYEDLEETFEGLVADYGLDPLMLHLEITESAYSENPEIIISAVNRLRSHGFVIEMDDFGSGYSSLNMLSQMNLDILKLDMAFISSELQKPLGHSILSDIIKMAHKMRLCVVAEGVETKEQVRRLKMVDCDYVQGYFFARPMAASDFESLLRSIRRPAAGTVIEDDSEKGSGRILIAADADTAFRNCLKSLFSDDFTVIEADNTDKAASLLDICSEADAAIMVISADLPGGDVCDVVSLARQNPRYWDIPILVTIDGPGRADYAPVIKCSDDFLCKSHPLFDLKRRVGNMSELSEARRKERALRTEANCDPLTGLLNRRGLKAAFERLHKDEQPLAVYMFDLDNLKIINDRLGHDAGDKVIMTFADLLKDNTRVGDILCRYGGDEFVAILRQVDDRDIVSRKGNLICSLLRQAFENDSINASCSSGAVICGREHEISMNLIDEADKAMYKAKEFKKGSCCVIDMKET